MSRTSMSYSGRQYRQYGTVGRQYSLIWSHMPTCAPWILSQDLGIALDVGLDRIKPTEIDLVEVLYTFAYSCFSWGLHLATLEKTSKCLGFRLSPLCRVKAARALPAMEVARTFQAVTFHMPRAIWGLGLTHNPLGIRV